MRVGDWFYNKYQGTLNSFYCWDIEMQHHQENKSIRTNVITTHVMYHITFHYTYKKIKNQQMILILFHSLFDNCPLLSTNNSRLNLSWVYDSGNSSTRGALSLLSPPVSLHNGGLMMCLTVHFLTSFLMFPEKAFTEPDLDLIPILKSMFTALHTNPFGVLDTDET